MHKVLRRQPWTCARCLRRQRRNQSTTAAVAQSPIFAQDHAYGIRDTTSSADDKILRDVFNNKGAWTDFSQAKKTSTGLIGNKYLTNPRGFYTFAQVSLHQCKQLVGKTLAASTIEEYRAIPRDLDRLSDLLCRVIDLSDFMRTIHPDQEITAAATGSYSMMFQYMNELNTTTGLNEQLKRASSIPEVYSQWSQEEQMVAQLLMKDFAKSGIDLPTKQREEFVSLSSEISQIGTDFVNQMEHASNHVYLSQSQLRGMDPNLAQQVRSWKKASIPVYSQASRAVMAAARDDSARRQVYIAERSASKRTIERLEDLLMRRAKLAKLTGYESFAQMTLADKMSKTPEAAIKFLESLGVSNRGQVEQELSLFLQMKRKLDSTADKIQPWDQGLLLNHLHHAGNLTGQRTSKSRLYESMTSYFSLGNVIQGLSRLFNAIYGIRLVPRETQIGEVWDPEVRRLDVHTDSGEHIATMYCDLFSRPGKLPNPAHFTLVCSREISQSECRENERRGEPLNDGMPTGSSFDPSSGERHHQIPVIALVCDFPSTTHSNEPSLLSLHSLTTLFHEMGHAVHSFLGRTSMQGISGTRCATDFAELPSILMEYFAADSQVLHLFARHWQTDALMPQEMIEAMKKEKLDRAGMTGGLDNQNQILMALLDQAYHSKDPVDALRHGRYDSTAVFHQVWDRYSSVQEPAETSWQGFFGHLYGYGATYYSYLFDRAIARQVWRTVFHDGADSGAINREAGEKFKNEVLRWGGGRDPWICLEGLMGEGKGVLAEGGELAMLEVGKWGVGAGAEGAM